MTLEKLQKHFGKFETMLKEYKEENPGIAQENERNLTRAIGIMQDSLSALGRKPFNVKLLFTVCYEEVWEEDSLETTQKYCREAIDNLTETINRVYSETYIDSEPYIDASFEIEELEW